MDGIARSRSDLICSTTETCRSSVAFSVNAARSYEESHEAVRAIERRIAFYPDRVDAITEGPGS